MEHNPKFSKGSQTILSEYRARHTWFERVLARNRYVLACALLLGAVAPVHVHGIAARLEGWAWSASGVQQSMVLVTLAIVSGHMSLSRLGVLPLISARGLILPTFMATFGAALLVFVAAGIPFVDYQVLSGFVIAIGWYLLISILRGRHLRPRIAMVGLPDDFHHRLPGNVEWEILREPRLKRRVSAVAIDPHAELGIEWSKFITSLVLTGVPVYHRSQIEEGLSGRVRFNSHADNDFGALLPSLAYLKVKRLIDIGLCLVLLPVFLVGIAVAAILIRLESPGRAIFRQVRMGHRGEPFICYKLRTMRSDAKGPSFTREGDSRITRLGRYLRKWRIDELPQIFNVLRGDMSWIGPRPEALDLALRYSEHVPFYDYRHAVRPGISGWAAVHQGNVGDVDAAAVKLEYDFYYIRNFSPSLDFLIVLKTVQTIWSGFGSR